MAVQTLDTLRSRLDSISAPEAPTGPAPVNSRTLTGFGDLDSGEPAPQGFGETVTTPPSTAPITDSDVPGGATSEPTPYTGPERDPNDQDSQAVAPPSQPPSEPTVTQQRGTDGVSAAETGQPAAAPTGFNPASVAGQVTNLISENSPYMQQANTIGRQVANRRGLLNSSIAADAATRAAMEYALPIAQQDASQHFQLQQAAQAFGFASQLSAQEATQRLTEINETFRNQGLLSQQEFQQASQLSDQEFLQTLGISRQEYEQNLALQERRIGSEYELALLDAETRQTLLTMEANLQTSLAEMDIAAEERTQMISMVTSMHELYQESLRSVLANPDMSAQDRNELLTAAADNLAVQTQMIESLFGIDINWVDAVIGQVDDTGGTDTGTGTTGTDPFGIPGSTGTTTTTGTTPPPGGWANVGP